MMIHFIRFPILLDSIKFILMYIRFHCALFHILVENSVGVGRDNVRGIVRERVREVVRDTVRENMALCCAAMCGVVFC